MLQHIRWILCFAVILHLCTQTSAWWWGSRRRCASHSCSWNWRPCSLSCGRGVQYAVKTASQGPCGSCSMPTSSRTCNTHCCARNCAWRAWGSWGSCSRTCGGGTQTRSRAKTSQVCGGAACTGSTSESRSCNQVCCPVHCAWAAWSSWGSCSRNCGGGVQTRNRSYSRGASCGGEACAGSSTDSRSCNQQCCPVHCSWGFWGNWTTCTATCGVAIQTRNRGYAIAESCSGNACSGPSLENRTCNQGCCPVHCSWSSWSNWGNCSVSCGGGTQSRNRGYAEVASCQGNICPGKSVETHDCNQHCCPVNCSWDSWTNWEKCSKTCGGGTQSRNRGYSTTLSCGGKSCSGDSVESKSCNGNCCPVDCAWTAWYPWNSCSVSCDGGIQVRERGMDPIAFCGGNQCNGSSSERQACNTECCPVDCAWDKWSDWSTCTKQCGSGTQKRNRSISVPSFCGGNECPGTKMESQNCNTQCCPVGCKWKPWGEWSTCTKTCEKGSQNRARGIAVKRSCGGSQCQGLSNETRLCNDVCCPVHCQWEQWSEWSLCTKTCDTGWKSRQRDLKVADVCRGEECAGSRSENVTCSTQCCPVNCVLTSWTEWTECSHSCGPAGTRKRHRMVTQKPECGGKACETDLRQIKVCNRFCINSGNLTNDACVCEKGWTGECCQQDVNECAFTSCTTNSKCFNADGSYECVCNHGYTMSEGYCLDVDECHQQLHDCHKMAGCFNLDGHYACLCDPGFSGNGTHCVDVDECSLEDGVNLEADDFYSSVENLLPPPCHDEATCINTYGSFACRCDTGYEGDGKTCEDVNECNLNSMMNLSHLNSSTKVSTENTQHEDGASTSVSLCDIHATCINMPGSYSCWCNNGYYGDGITCHDINECSSEPCQNGGACDDLVNAFFCTCRKGFTGNLCQTDVNECTLDSDTTLNVADEVNLSGSGSDETSSLCHPNATCSNTFGSFVCACQLGYTGDGFICSDVDECAPDNESGIGSESSSGANSFEPCHSNASCYNVIGNYSCRCNNGYVGNGFICKDIDECHSDPCSNGATCANLVDAFRCQCTAGFKGLHCEIDVNECRDGTDDCDPENGKCINTTGSYKCICKEGFSGDGKTCTDINECFLGMYNCGENKNCLNHIGGYACTCQDGYEMESGECKDTDECQDGVQECDSENGRCINTPGSHKCVCKDGFSGDGKICTDINECVLMTHQCKENQNCVNHNGNYGCECEVGYKVENGECKDVDECVLETHYCEANEKCLNLNGSYSCVCKDGYEIVQGGECREAIPGVTQDAGSKSAFDASRQSDFTKALQKPSFIAIGVLAGILAVAVVILAVKMAKRRSTSSFTLQPSVPSIVSDSLTEEIAL